MNGARFVSRRRFLGAAALAAGTLPGVVVGREKPLLQIAAFAADVTPPRGHPLLAGLIASAKEIADPLHARGFVLRGVGKPIVFVAIDWCEIRNDAHARWRDVLAKAADTEPARVLVHSVHQHDAPLADVLAQQLLRKFKVEGGAILDLTFHERCVEKTAQALRDALTMPQTVTHLGLGVAQVEKLASNRRVDNPDGTFHFSRTSASAKQYGTAPEGLIDPVLRTLSFWDGDKPLLALHAYAVHPMSWYGQGVVSWDFPGRARERRQGDQPGVFQIYASGCSGNVTAGKYNDGARENRPILADRLYQAMKRAWQETKRHPLEGVRFSSTPLRLEPRAEPAFQVAALQGVLADPKRPFREKSLAALGLSWRLRADAGATLDVPALDFGPAQLLLLPAEAYVEFQLHAQKQRPGGWVMALGYGECAPGYIPTDKHFEWKDGNLRDWCWVAPGSEPRLNKAIEAALRTH